MFLSHPNFTSVKIRIIVVHLKHIIFYFSIAANWISDYFWKLDDLFKYRLCFCECSLCLLQLSYFVTPDCPHRRYIWRTQHEIIGQIVTQSIR